MMYTLHVSTQHSLTGLWRVSSTELTTCTPPDRFLHVCPEVSEAGAVLVALLESKQPGVQSASSGALRSLSDNSQHIKDDIIAAEVALVRSKQPTVQVKAVWAWLDLCCS